MQKSKLVQEVLAVGGRRIQQGLKYKRSPASTSDLLIYTVGEGFPAITTKFSRSWAHGPTCTCRAFREVANNLVPFCEHTIVLTVLEPELNTQLLDYYLTIDD